MTRLILLLVLLSSCATVDLRPESAPTDSDRRDGAALLRELADAHGGRQAWLEQRVIRVRMNDRWKGRVMYALAGPWPKNGTPFELTFLAGRGDGRLRFTEVDEPDWGIQHWRTYKVEEGGEPVFKRDKDIEFWLPTTTYFVEAPFRLMEATTVYRLEPRTVNGRLYERVFATWGDDAPQDKVDQYVVWIDAETRRLGWLQYTIRDFGDWMVGIMAYEDIVDVKGFTLARQMGTVDEPGGKPTLHRFTIDSFDIGVPVDESHIVPRPDLRGQKY